MKMPPQPSNNQLLLAENAELRARLEVAEGILSAIHAGAEDAQQEVERNYRALAVASSEIAYRMTADWSTMLPLDGRQLVPSSDQPLTDWAWLDNIIPPHEQPRVRLAISEAIARKTLFEMEHRVWRPDGSVGWTFSRAVPILDENQDVIAWFGAASDITERKQAEEQLRFGERRFRGIFDSAYQYIGLMTPEGTLLEANRTALEGGGLRAEDVIGKPFWECNWWTLTERTGQELRNAIRRAASGELVRYDVEVRGAGGQVDTIDFSIKPVLDEDGRVVLLVPEGRDITDLKRAEKALLTSTDELQTLLDTLPGFVWISRDAECRVIVGNRTSNEFLGVKGETNVSQSMVALSKSNYLRQLKEDGTEYGADELPLQRAITTGLPVRNAILDFRFGDGRRAQVVGDAVPLFDEQGRIRGGLAVFVDITDRMQAEAITRVSEVRYRRLFESAKDGILILDAHAATITDANPFITELLGYSPGEIQGKELWQIGLFQDVEANKGAMQELQAKGYIRYEDLPLETKTGQRINVEFVSNVYSENGDAVIQCNIRDISDRKRLEESLRIHAADLSEIDRRKDVFLATLAHELRNPLAPIRNGLQIMKLAHVDAGTVEKVRSMMDRQVDQMTRLINDLVDVSRINQGKLQLQKSKMSLADAVRNAVETSSPLMDAQGHELVVDMPSEPIELDADLTRLSQVFVNVLNNAAKYTERGGQIRLAVERQGSDAVVCVADNGVGIPANMLVYAFDMFSQIDYSFEKSQGGLGIGLNIVKRLVEMHGGSITAESGGPGLGSTFTVRLPVVPSATTDRPDGRSNDPKAKPARRRILVVDDNVNCAISLAMFFDVLGNETQTAHNGLEAVALAEAFKPEMILMDIGMPKLNGYEACRQIREQPWGRNIVIVAHTGWGQADDKRKSQEAGFDFHMVKPIDPADLEKILAELN